MDRLRVEAPESKKTRTSQRILVVGVGNHYRHDDEAGLYVAKRLRDESEGAIPVREEPGRVLDLVEEWHRADVVFVVDAVVGGNEPGTIYRFEICEGIGCDGEIPGNLFLFSTHGIGVAESIKLARLFDKLPPRLIVYGIEGEHFEMGEGLSIPVLAAAERVVSEIIEYTKAVR